MKYLLVTLAALVAMAYSSSVAEEAEKAAFTLCDSDGNGCLSWAETEVCEVVTKTPSCVSKHSNYMLI